MKDRIQDILKSFFVSTALINVAMYVCGSLFRPDQRFGYEVFLYPLIYGFLATIPNFIMYSKKELTVKQAVIREMVNILLIVAIIELFMFGGKDMSNELCVQAISVAVSIVVVYMGVVFIMYILDLKTARRLTDQLRVFQYEDIKEQQC
ncbi:MAG: DUF3021 family protein [Lachnospiraceae bacterium]|nr:DUF3021 family protein [Lachnospiraceae bacterium]